MIDTSRYLHSPGCLVYHTNDVVNTTASTFIKLTYDTSIYNDNAAFNFTTNEWLAPKAGRIVVESAEFIDRTSSTGGNFITYDFRRFDKTNTEVSRFRVGGSGSLPTGISTLSAKAFFEVDYLDRVLISLSCDFPNFTLLGNIHNYLHIRYLI